MEILVVFVVFTVFVLGIVSSSETAKLQVRKFVPFRKKNYVKNPDAETSKEGWTPARPLVAKVEAPVVKDVEYAMANVSNFNPTEVWLHKMEELNMIMIYDPKTRMAESNRARWKIESQVLLQRNYFYIGEF